MTNNFAAVLGNLLLSNVKSRSCRKTSLEPLLQMLWYSCESQTFSLRLCTVLSSCHDGALLLSKRCHIWTALAEVNPCLKSKCLKREQEREMRSPRQQSGAMRRNLTRGKKDMKHPLNTLGTTKVANNKCVGKTSVTRKQENQDFSLKCINTV